jgi:hypothetical protein
MIRRGISLFLGAVALISLLPVTGCMPTYPAEKLPEAIKEVCKIEYDMDVRAARNGSTIGIYYPMKGLLDVGLGVSEEAWDTISDLILIASRVVLSTDADIKFYCVVTQDPRLPELQVVIIKYVDDVKRSMYRNISRGESFRRTLFSINLTPQAKKERSVEKVFNKLGVEDGVRGKVMEEFFRSPPTELSDIGFWKDQFFLKDITLAEFLAAQIANRIKLAFRGEQDLTRRFSFKNAEGEFIRTPDKGFFNIKFKIQDATDEGGPEALRKAKVEEILRIAGKVVKGYKFRDFAYIQLEDQLENAVLEIKKENIYSYERGGTALEDVVKAPAGYFMPAAAR